MQLIRETSCWDRCLSLSLSPLHTLSLVVSRKHFSLAAAAAAAAATEFVWSFVALLFLFSFGLYIALSVRLSTSAVSLFYSYYYFGSLLMMFCSSFLMCCGKQCAVVSSTSFKTAVCCSRLRAFVSFLFFSFLSIYSLLLLHVSCLLARLLISIVFPSRLDSIRFEFCILM